MRTIGFLLLQLFLVTSVYGQDIEYSVHFNSGIFFFGGQSATAQTFAVNPTGDAYTNNPYGSNGALSYGLAIQVQRLTSHNVLFGLQGGYEALRSSVDINSVENVPASGNTILRHSFINLHPQIGYRFSIQKFDVDITAGPEVGFMLNSYETGEADIDGGGTLNIENERPEMGNDYRLRAQVVLHYKNWGFSTGYSHGLRNYRGSTVGDNRKSYARFVRFGIFYSIF